MKNFKYTINGNSYDVVINGIEDNVADVEVNGISYEVVMDKPVKKQTFVEEKRLKSNDLPPLTQPQRATGASALRSPLPGVILDVSCKVGDTVKKGQKVMVLEAMKMENVINADRDGVVKEIKVSKGDSVLEGDDLIVIE